MSNDRNSQLHATHAVADSNDRLDDLVLELVQEKQQVSAMIEPASCIKRVSYGFSGMNRLYVELTIVTQNSFIQHAALALLDDICDPD